MVLINRRLQSNEVPSVTPDDAAGASMAVEHLVSLGHTPDRAPRRPAGHLHRAGAHPRLPRRAARPRARRRPGAGRDLLLLDRGRGRPGAARAARLGRRRSPPCSRATTCSRSAATTCSRSAGWPAPATCRVMGFNDMPFIDKLRPPLTSVRVPHYQVGAEAARMLIETLQDPTRQPAVGAAAAHHEGRASRRRPRDRPPDPAGEGQRVLTSVRSSASVIFLVSRGGSWMVRSASVMPASSSRPRSSSALSSAPKSTARLEIQSQTRATTTAASEP